MAGYTKVTRDEAADWMSGYEGFGEMRSYTRALGSEETAITWRLMPPGTGGRDSYGHRHKDQEEIYLVVRGTLQFKVGDDEFEAGPQTAVRVPADSFRSVHNDGPDEVEVVICSKVAQGDEGEVEKSDGFWPSS
jgi:mannose-6-phosphate isomerase-like protein (cupin superfamily)